MSTEHFLAFLENNIHELVCHSVRLSIDPFVGRSSNSSVGDQSSCDRVRKNNLYFSCIDFDYSITMRF